MLYTNLPASLVNNLDAISAQLVQEHADEIAQAAVEALESIGLALAEGDKSEG